jgi:DNA-binding Lrp family transcriptional regulator
MDRKILSVLQVEGRITNVELARRVGMSAPPCLRRVRAMERAGVIKNFQAVVDDDLLGFEVTIFVLVVLDRRSEVEFSTFERRAENWDIVRNCYRLTGEVDYLLKCVSVDLRTFQTFITNELTIADNVSHIRTLVTDSQTKIFNGIPFDD